MRLALSAFALLLSTAASAQVPAALDLSTLCQGRTQGVPSASAQAGGLKFVQTPGGPLGVLDRGFCSAYLLSEHEQRMDEAWRKPMPALESLQASAGGDPDPYRPPSKKWKVRMYLSHSFTTYFHSDMSFRSSRYNVEVKDYEWAERGSRSFFSPATWAKKGNNPLQIIDEPTNTFVVSIERDGNEFFLSAFHPKFEQGPDQVKYMKGTIDGTPVDGYQPINKPFDGYDQVPGESELVRNENTYREMLFEVGYGRRITLLSGRRGSVTYVPGIAAGVAVGNNYSVVVQEGKWWDFDGYSEKYGVQGVGASLTNRIELNGPKARFGLFYENKLSMYKMKTGFLDGTQRYDLGLMGNSVGMKVTIYDPRRHPPRHRPID